jgi:diguanylate cyclase (GGDEF)-like protein
VPKELDRNTIGPEAPDLGRLEEALKIERKWRETAVSYGKSLEAILANLKSGVLVLDKVGNVLYSNQALANLFELSRERMSRMTRDQVFREVAQLFGDPGGFIDKMKLVGNTANPVFEEFEIDFQKIGCVSKPITLPSGVSQLIVFTNTSREADDAADVGRRALVDGLTGLSNRRAADLAIAREAARTDRYDSQLAFALFDIDFFKKINDTYGHEGGDLVLREVGGLMTRLQRTEDTVARWGGEEFLTILVNSDLSGARTHAEHIRAEVEKLTIEGLGPVRVSAGVSEYKRGETPASAIKRADENLYHAKKSGRNRVCHELPAPQPENLTAENPEKTGKT